MTPFHYFYQLVRVLAICFLFGQNTAFAKGLSKLLINGHSIRTEIVSGVAEQKLGLGNRESLQEGRGMLFIYSSPGEKIFWMKRMKFAIDIIWIYKGKIVHIEKQIPPPSIMSSDSALKTYGHGIIADMVLEVTAGYSDKVKMNPGTAILIQP